MTTYTFCFSLIRSFCEFFLFLGGNPPANNAPDQTVKNFQNIKHFRGGPTLQECLDSADLPSDTLLVTRWAVLDNLIKKILFDGMPCTGSRGGGRASMAPLAPSKSVTTQSRGSRGSCSLSCILAHSVLLFHLFL